MSSSSPEFSCAICFDTAAEPVVTRCGHLFCWGCLDTWLSRPQGVPECPVCKGRVDEKTAGDIIPLYGQGRREASDTRPHAPGESGSNTPAPPQPQTSSHAQSPPQQGERGQGTAQQEPHRRPDAPRAPTPPRSSWGGAASRRRNGLSLSFGSGCFIFGGFDPMLTIMLIAIWAFYNFAPWRECVAWGRDMFNRDWAPAGQQQQQAPPPPSSQQQRQQRAADSTSPSSASAETTHGNAGATGAAPHDQQYRRAATAYADMMIRWVGIAAFLMIALPLLF